MFMSDFMRETANRIEEMEEWFLYAMEKNPLEGMVRYFQIAENNNFPLEWAVDYWNEMKERYY